jgi:hypothetical protein
MKTLTKLTFALLTTVAALTTTTAGTAQDVIEPPPPPPPPSQHEQRGQETPVETSSESYGTDCHISLDVEVFITSRVPMVRFRVDGAHADMAVQLRFGDQRFARLLPGTSCLRRTNPLTTMVVVADAFGRAEIVLPWQDVIAAGPVYTQAVGFATIGTESYWTSRGWRLAD